MNLILSILIAINLFPIAPGGVERRIPAITTVEAGEHEGRLLTVYDFRWDGGDIGNGNISLQIATSDDNGATWSKPRFACDASGEPVTNFNRDVRKTDAARWEEIQQDANKNWDCAFGDACIVSDRETGKMLLMSCAGPILFWNSRYDNPNQCVRWYSDDGGDTWTGPERLTYDILDLFKAPDGTPLIDGQFIASGKIMQSRKIKRGDHYRLYAAIATQTGGIRNPQNYVIYSDDFGKSWKVLGGREHGCAVDEYGDESKCEELPDGSVLLAGRGTRGNRTFNVFRYSDIARGEGEWGKHINTDLGTRTWLNACNGEIMIIPAVNAETGEKASIALQSIAFSHERKNVSIAWKVLPDSVTTFTPEDFRYWDALYQVTDAMSAYSTMCLQKDGRIGLFYEEQRTGRPYDGVYEGLTIETITDGKWQMGQ